MGAYVIHAGNIGEVKQALAQARDSDRTTVIAVEVDREQRVPGYEPWWDVPVAEVSEVDLARRAREYLRELGI